MTKKKKDPLSSFKGFNNYKVNVPPQDEAFELYPQGLTIPMWLRKLHLIDLWRGDDLFHNNDCEVCGEPGNLL